MSPSGEKGISSWVFSRPQSKGALLRWPNGPTSGLRPQKASACASGEEESYPPPQTPSSARPILAFFSFAEMRRAASVTPLFPPHWTLQSLLRCRQRRKYPLSFLFLSLSANHVDGIEDALDRRGHPRDVRPPTGIFSLNFYSLMSPEMLQPLILFVFWVGSQTGAALSRADFFRPNPPTFLPSLSPVLYVVFVLGGQLPRSLFFSSEVVLVPRR